MLVKPLSLEDLAISPESVLNPLQLIDPFANLMIYRRTRQDCANRPSLVKTIGSPRLLRMYAAMDVSDRKQISAFHASGYLKGEGDLDLSPYKTTVQYFCRLVSEKNKVRIFFDFCKEHENNIFNTNYIRTNQELNASFSNAGYNWWFRCYQNFPQGGEMVLRLALEQWPDMEMYVGNRDSLALEVVQDAFSYYKVHDIKSTPFNAPYITHCQGLHQYLDSRLELFTIDNKLDTVRIQRFLRRASKLNPEIDKYHTVRSWRQIKK